MSFVKVGDNQKISAFFDDNKVMTCDKCGKVIDTLQITDQNEPVCTCEEPDDE